MCKKERGDILDYYGIIYSAKNLTNNKRYIGQTTCTLEKRKKEHINSVSKQKFTFQKAMKKYGIENFLWEVIDYADSPEELDYKETYWIDHFNTYGHEGYNMTIGGQKNHTPSKEERIEYLRTKHDDRIFLVFDKLGNFIEESDNRFLFCVENDMTTGDLNQSLKNRRPSVGDYILIYKDKFTEENLKNRISKVRNTKDFVVFDKNNNYLGCWNNQTRCCEEINISTRGIQRQLNENANRDNLRKYKIYYIDDTPDNLKSFMNK